MPKQVYSDVDATDPEGGNKITISTIEPDNMVARFLLTLKSQDNPMTFAITLRRDRIPALIGALAVIGNLSVTTAVQTKGTQTS